MLILTLILQQALFGVLGGGFRAESPATPAAAGVAACCAIECCCPLGCECSAQAPEDGTPSPDRPAPRPAQDLRDLLPLRSLEIVVMAPTQTRPATRAPRSEPARLAGVRAQAVLCIWTT
ncbi:MAG: hypothetical protein EA376_12890 [Phycisphaeraceae bacterium]|nr:MAG: hypothetical protein EA376_12890 [Phycisphaeraceae bacterium]